MFFYAVGDIAIWPPGDKGKLHPGA